MMKKIFMFVLSAMVLTSNAQTASSAQDITKIKKSRQYIYAEVTAETEDAAYSAAKSELDAQIDKHILDSGMAKESKAVIVSNIGKMTNKISVRRGDMHRVFIYVRKSDILASNSYVEIVNIEREAPETNVKKEGQQEVATATATATVSEDSFFSLVKGARAVTLAAIANATSMSMAESILAEQRTLMNVKGYGVQSECRSVPQSYWVVAGANGITILSPERNGQRWNYKTGKTDTLNNYEEKLWFRL